MLKQLVIAEVTPGLSFGKLQLSLLLAWLCISGISSPAYAQHRFDGLLGVGYYELAHAGIFWNYSKKSSLGIYAGTNFNRHNEKLVSTGLTFRHIFTKPLFWKIQPGYSLTSQYWTQDDLNYYFTNLCFLLEGSLIYPFNDRLRIQVKGGGVLNYTIETDRKQNTTAGFPLRWNGNGSFSVIYSFIKK